MGFFSGRVTCTRFRVAGRSPRSFGPEQLEQLTAYAMGQQRVAMKKAGGGPAKKPGRKRAPRVAAAAPSAATPAPTTAKTAGPADLIEAGVEWVPYWLDRMERFYKQPPGGAKKSDLPARNPREYVAAGRVCFSCELDEARIGMVAEAIGHDCILYSSDLPHAHRVFDAIALFRGRRDVPETTKAKILANGARFFAA